MNVENCCFDYKDNLRLQINSYVTENNSNFDCFRFCSNYNILKLYSHHTHIDTLNLSGNEKDSLYINVRYYKSPHTPHLDNCIYITKHIHCHCLTNKKSVLDYLNSSIELKEEFSKVLYFPQKHFWSHDGGSIEFINDLEIKNYKYPTFGMYLNRYTEQRDDVGLIDRKRNYFSIFYKFITLIETSFLKTNFLPYFIHPNRMLFYNNDTLKIISGNLFCFLFTPHEDSARIRNATFSHPISLVFEENEKITAQEYLDRTTINIIADFFHSSFVTTLWICLLGQYKNTYTLKRNRGREIKNRKTNSSSSSSSELFSPCNNKFGFCTIFKNYNNNNNEEMIIKLNKDIHNYGCIHLLDVFPKAIKESIDLSFKSGTVEPLKTEIKNLFSIFKAFICELRANVIS